MSITNQCHHRGLIQPGMLKVLSCPLRRLIKEVMGTLWTKLINMFHRERLRSRVVYDFDLALSSHEMLVNFDLLLASDHKAFVHARQYVDRSCLYLIIAWFNMVMSFLVF